MYFKHEKIFAVESSCDESALAFFDSQKGILFEIIHSQIDLHSIYGGVVPDLASTEHLKKLPELCKQIPFDLNDANIIAVTSGPGLPNCLAMGMCTANAISIWSGKSLRGVNHLRGHTFSPFINIHKNSPENFAEELEKLLPHLGLVVSGGNTMLIEIDENLKISLLSETVDDAAGEALDKGAKLLGIPYPGGPMLEKYALEGDYKKFNFPKSDNEFFSFSGLKTSLRYFLDKLSPEEIKAEFPHICASYQYAAIEQLKKKALRFLKQKKYNSLGLSGGVANNALLRQKFDNLSKTFGVKFLCADKEHRGDNASMIAFAAWIDSENCQNDNLKLSPNLGL